MEEQNFNNKINDDHNSDMENGSSEEYSRGVGWWRKYRWLVITGVVVLVIVVSVVAIFAIRFKKDEIQIQPQLSVDKKEQRVIRRPEPAKVSVPGYLSLEPVALDVGVDGEFEVRIMIDTSGYNISAASAVLDYDATKLEVVKINTKESVMTMSARKRAKDGRIEIIRGKPGDSDWRDSDDGFTGKNGLLAIIIFRAINTGEARVDFVEDESKLVLDDAMGTGMDMEYKGGIYVINAE